jgi:hypothetical protein
MEDFAQIGAEAVVCYNQLAHEFVPPQVSGGKAPATKIPPQIISRPGPSLENHHTL